VDLFQMAVPIDTQSGFTHDLRHSDGIGLPRHHPLFMEEDPWNHPADTGLTVP
jgi:hypothetical protein